MRMAMDGSAGALDVAQETRICALLTAGALCAPEGLAAIEALRVCCAELTDRVEWLGDPRGAGLRGALIDLGRRSPAETQAACDGLLGWLAEWGLPGRVGAGPTLTIAQLAALAAPVGAARVIAPAEAAAFIQTTPVKALARLPGETAPGLTPETPARLRHFGLRTLGQVARLDARDPQALRRQFGATVGATLAILARGYEARSLRPARMPEFVTARLCCAIGEAGLTPEQALAALPRLAARLARRLAERGRCGRTLRLCVVWAAGGEARHERWLARPYRQAGELAQAASALLALAVGAEAAAWIASLALELGDLAPLLPAQPAPLFALPATPTRSRARERLERIALEVAEPLARRYGAPALYRLATTQPDAILPEERAR
ncbi:MAG TPA: hypothetical protein VF725_11345, partial [Ktedonobacterales bacterium]